MARRRPSLTVRILRTVLIVLGPLLVYVAVRVLIPSLPQGMAATMGGVSMFWLLSALILIPALLSPGSDSDSGPDSDGGGGSGPKPTPPSPGAPTGGVPLPDAEQARDRLRDHVRPAWRRVRQRRRVHEPERVPLHR